MSDLREAMKAAVGAVSDEPALSREHPAIIRSQSGQTVSVDFEANGPARGASDVPLVYGIPGVKALIKNGQRARVSYENGNPTTRIATGFDPYERGDDPELPVPQPVDELNICGASDTQGAARIGDETACGALIFRQTPVGPGGVPSVLGIFYRDAFGIEVPVLTFPIPGPAVMIAMYPEAPDPTTAIVPIGGKISTGSAIVKIGG